MPKRLIKKLPAPVREDPFEVFTALLLLLASLPMMVGATPPPGSLTRLLPLAAQIAWGWSIGVSSALVLAGLAATTRSTNITVVLRGRTIERLGLIGLAWSVLFYTVAIVLVGGWAGVMVAAILMALAVACTTRAVALSEARRMLQAWRQDHPKGGQGP